MNKLDFIRARTKVVSALNEASEQRDTAATAIAAKLASKGTLDQPAPNKLDIKKRIANTALGLELREVPYSAEIDRIVTMPIVHPMDKVEFDQFCKDHIIGETFENGFRFYEVQAEGISAYEQYNGGFFPIGVGFGKTLTGLAIANIAFLKGIKRILLLVPSQVLDQLTSTDIKWARSKIPFNLPVHVIGGRDSGARKALCSSGKKGLYIMPYSYLSVKDTTEMLLSIQAQLIICDEAHNLANRGSARTKRLMDYVEKFKPEGVMMSGTITSKSIRDYFHLIKWALGKYNPLPNSMALANDWAQIIDAVSTGTYGDGASDRGASGPLMPLIRWAERQFPREQWQPTIPGFRKAYKQRLNTAPGVVSSGDASIGTSLTFANVPISKEAMNNAEHDKLETLWEKVENEWLTPNGDEIDHAIHTWKWLYELTAGFYNELSWPLADAYAKRKRISEPEAVDILEKSKTHHRSGQVYTSALRKWLEKNQKPHIDTPFLVGQDMSRNGSKNVGEELFVLWQDWKNLDFEGRPDRDSHSIRVSDYKIKAAVDWAKGLGEEGGLIWVWHQEMGVWCYEELVKAGINAAHCPAGDQYNQMLTTEEKPLKDKVTVVSITAHGTGKNLQYFQHNYFLQWPRQDTAAEQTVGRTHRNGQTADELVVTTNITNEFDQLNFAACLNDALYIHQTTGNRQKLIYANYDPIPKIFPSAVIHERGGQNRILSRDQERLMKERFEK